MRSIFRAALAVAVIVQAGCRTESHTAPLDDEFTIRSNASVTIDRSALNIRLLGVLNDSRCARDVVCVWSGNAEVLLEARQDGAVDTLRLNTHIEPRQALAGRYLVHLVGLAPEPRSDRAIDPAEYRVTLRVSMPNIACTAVALSAMTVALVDSLDPARTTFRNVRVLATDGAFRDSVQTDSLLPGMKLGLVYERAGRYTVTVRAEGYAPWTATDILVRRDICHVITVPVTATLRRQH